MERGSKILLAGQSRMINLAVMNHLKSEGFNNLITIESKLTNQREIQVLFESEKPDCVFLLGGRWAGLFENIKCPADLNYDNTQTMVNIIYASWQSGVKKLLFLASSCVYPEHSPQPMKEEDLLTGKLEPISEPSALARILAIRMCQYYNRQYGTNFVSAVPTGIYGPDDDFCPETGHVLPALIQKFHEAKVNSMASVFVWGSGNSCREWIYVDDVADACVFLMDTYSGSEIINMGVGEDLTIKELAKLVAEIVGFKGGITFDLSRAEGAYRKLLDSSRINALGWKPKVSLREGISKTYEWYKSHI